MFENITLFLILSASSVAVTGMVLLFLRKRAILDHPNHRSSHKVPTPRGGGIAVTSIILAVWLWQLGPDGALLDYLPLGVGFLLAGMSWLDDIYDLSAKIRFLAQLVLTGMSLPWVFQHGIPLEAYLPVWLIAILIILAWTAFINFFNFMDGIDGISGVEAIGIGLGFTLITLSSAQSASNPFPTFELAPGLLIAAATAGFLIWNWHPAKIFLGDVGSIPLGYFLGGLLLVLAARGEWAAAIILPGYYLTDAGLTLLKRIIRREKIWEAHRDHYYQRAVRSGHSHARVSLMIALTNCGLIILAGWSVAAPYYALAAAAALIGLLIFWMNSRHAEKSRGALHD
ncbi:MraY family glycosyltransferase [Aestuariispira insulae]|uniref:UDP-N-acetylmuramyl pentapeptide phosphotransferase/UDP-N-acetylglucosamine-1-phosphate transferase n=1 Tax=Aestuariispira insulae TaxID=1461337 RepID=A0A3D9HIC1_9PROT|nr:glycosyltransferase family 4 protein [Aestuariispira insulae]RED49208.1 UDP-N-acetylmuramyl pentapeptide phosphotransferase/UDP-N-acetylglucosamine-1-phosphate transferase [Aestuariispira insulae]